MRGSSAVVAVLPTVAADVEQRNVADGRASQTVVSSKMRDGTSADCASLRRAASYCGRELDLVEARREGVEQLVGVRLGERRAEVRRAKRVAAATSARATSDGRQRRCGEPAEREWREMCKR